MKSDAEITEKVVMVKKRAFILILVVACLAGCNRSKKIGPSGKLEKPVSLVDYLQQQDLRELESIERWESEYGSGLKLTTAHYEIYTTLQEPLMLRAIPGFMESAYDGYNSQLAEPIESATKSTIYLFADRAQWEDFTKTFTGDRAELYLKIKAGAYYLNGACVIYNIGAKRTFTALGHEGWHQFNNRHFKFRLPSCLDEGIATLFEAHKTEQGGFVFQPADNSYRLIALKNTIAKNKMIPLRELIALDPGGVLITDESKAVMAFYSQSYALARFLREYSCDGGHNSFCRLLMDGLNGNWPLGPKTAEIAIDRNLPRTFNWNRTVSLLLLRRYISSDLNRFEREYLAFCKKIVSELKTDD